MTRIGLVLALTGSVVLAGASRGGAQDLEPPPVARPRPRTTPAGLPVAAGSDGRASVTPGSLRLAPARHDSQRTATTSVRFETGPQRRPPSTPSRGGRSS